MKSSYNATSASVRTALTSTDVAAGAPAGRMENQQCQS
jgi:hypothetical protein